MNSFSKDLCLLKSHSFPGFKNYFLKTIFQSFLFLSLPARKFIFIIGILFSSVSIAKSAEADSPSHNPRTDSLQNVLKTAKEDTVKISLLNALCFELRKESPAEAIQFAEQALKSANDLHFKKGIAESLKNMGLVYSLSSNTKKALECYLESLTILNETGDKKEIIQTLAGTAELYKKQKNFDKAIEFYSSAFKLSEEIAASELSVNKGEQNENKRNEADLIFRIGDLYQNKNEFDTSLKHFFKALKIYEALKDEIGIADVSVSIGTVYYSKSNQDKSQSVVFIGIHKEATAYLLKAKKIYQKNNNKQGIIRADDRLAYISAGQLEYGKGLEYAFEGLKLSKETNDEATASSLYHTIGNIYYAQGNYKSALEYLERCYEGAKNSDNKNYLSELYLSFARTNAKLNNYKNAYEFYLLYSDMKDTLLSELTGKQIMEINAKYDSEKKDKQLLKKESEIKQQHAETEKQQTIRDIFIIGFGLVLVLAFIIFRGYRSKQKNNIIITEKKEEVEKLYNNSSILSEISKEITSSLSIEKIVEKVYENVNKLMDADVFCIGIYNKEKNSIDFPGFIEKGKKFNSSYDLNDNSRLPVVCFKNAQEIFINDLEKEYKKYIPFIPPPVAGETPESIIYLPLFSKEKVIGVITVESFKKNAYSRYHVNVIKNLAVYVSIALENAQLYENLEEKVAERTEEVLKQKEEVEKSYQNTKLLSDIGREITTVLSVEEIIEKIYENVNKLMDASVLSIGIYEPEKNSLRFPGDIENGEKLPVNYQELNDEERLCTLCFTKQKEILITDIHNEYNNYFPNSVIPEPVAGEQSESIIYLPLSTPGKQIGVITVQSFKRNAYTQYHLDIIRTLGIYAVNALENARLYNNMEQEVKSRTQEVINQKEELEISHKNISILSEIGQEITSLLSAETIIEKVYENVNKLMDATVFTIGIYNAEKKQLEFIGTIENGEKIPFQTIEITDNDRLPSICFNERRIIFTNNYREDYKKYFSSMPKPVAGIDSESIIYIPLIIKNKPIGVITVQSFRQNAFTEYHLNILQSMAVYAAIALENAQLYENLEEKIEERTVEVLQQKEEVEKSYENTKLLSNIGREITAVLSVEEIIKTVYENVNKLMDASAFGIGIYNETEQKIAFSGFIEKGEKLPFYFNELKDDGRPSVWCFKNQKEIFINDLQKEYNNYFPNKAIPVPMAGEQAESIIYLPLSTPDKRIGVITVQSFKPNAYSQYQLDIIRNLAVYAVNALENARLYENMEDEVKYRTQEVIKQKEELEISYNDINVLSEIGQQLTSTLDFESIFSKLHESINRLMNAETFGVRIYNAEKNTVEVKYEFDKSERTKPFSFSMENEDNYSVWCIKNKKEIFINDNLSEYKNYVKNVVVINGEMTLSNLFCPMILKDIVIGVITVQSYQKNSYTRHHLDILRTLANYTAIALENAQLYENMEGKVKERTVEVMKQKEEVEKLYQNTKLLSDIGREITAVLSVEEIINKVYENVNKLMDAAAFGIGIFNEEKKQLDFNGFIENGEKLPYYNVPIAEKTRPAVWCFINQKEFVVNNFRKEYKNYFPDSIIPAPKEGEQPEGIIYLPLSTPNKLVGVITVQSFQKNAYSEYQLDILRNLAVYVVNGLENARLYETMEDEVKARTAEIEKQNDELARLSIVASETDNGVLIFGAGGEIEWVNDGFTRLQGYGIDELKQRGKTLEKISHNPEIKTLITDSIKNKKSSIYQALNITKSGKELWVQSSLTPILNEKGNIKKWVIIDTDVTDRKKAEDNLRQQNEKITDSINYAKSIQEALLPPIEEITKHLHSSFILYKPKDIVSGDFYWIYQDKERVLLAVADCTGHGVPGAFMSLMGNNFLNDIIKVKGIYTPSKILDELNIQILNTLNQSSQSTSVKYGMDIALISLEYEHEGEEINSFEKASQKNKKVIVNKSLKKSVKKNSAAESTTHMSDSKHIKTCRLQYAGAHSPLLIFRTNECIPVIADKRSIGSYKKEGEKDFANHTIQLLKGDMLYMFSDGFADQIGGPEGKKMFAQPFRDLLQSVCSLQMPEQKRILDETIINWQGNKNQTDDILVVGFLI